MGFSDELEKIALSTETKETLKDIGIIAAGQGIGHGTAMLLGKALGPSIGNDPLTGATMALVSTVALQKAVDRLNKAREESRQKRKKASIRKRV